MTNSLPNFNVRPYDMKVFQHVRAPNDTNGNPRRLFLVHTGLSTVAVDEGYAGRPSYLSDGSFTEMPDINVTAGEYKRLLKRFG